MIEQAERSGALKPGQTVIEATSGNTGIGLAMVCAQKGYPLVVTMAESFSVERRKMLRFLGARVVLTPASEKGTGMLAKAVELAERHGWFLCRQFENEANADVHTRTTAQEILADFAGEPLDYWVTGFGTGGTLKGVARALRKASPTTKIVAAEPDNAQVLGSGIPQPRDANGAISGSHPRFRPHLMQGWSPDFISRLTEDAVGAGWVDEIVPVSGAEALRLARELARQEGIFVGTSSGATLAAALEVARRSKPGTNIVCMLPDTGERYLSTPLFEHIGEEMTSRGARDFALDTPLSLRCACASGRRGRVAARQHRCLGGGARDSARPRRARAAVRARMVRVLLERAQVVCASRHRVSQHRSRLGRVPGRRTRWPDPGGTRKADGLADDPSGLHRRSARRWLHGSVRSLARRLDPAATDRARHRP